VDAVLGKKKHFNAADRKRPKVVTMGWAPVVISLLLASGFFFQAQQHFPEIARWVGTGLGVLAALLSWFDTAYGFVPDRHRSAANRFLQIQNDSEDLLAAYRDHVVDLNVLSSRLHSLRDQYALVNSEAERCPTNRQDFENARRGIRDGEEHYLDDELAD
jgi:hypothetical protein